VLLRCWDYWLAAAWQEEPKLHQFPNSPKRHSPKQSKTVGNCDGCEQECKDNEVIIVFEDGSSTT